MTRQEALNALRTHVEALRVEFKRRSEYWIGGSGLWMLAKELEEALSIVESEMGLRGIPLWEELDESSGSSESAEADRQDTE